ncbi:MAG TPA: VWA domain-containing protein [Vicinamibacterales bacterium]|nr:VWA domain-containing protein [Vicinamibacterales bacterium]
MGILKRRTGVEAWRGRAATVAAIAVLGAAPGAQQAPSPPRPVFRAATELVLVNVVVRDRSGAVVRGLTRDDFAVTEDGRPQAITSFDFEELDRSPAPAAAEPAPVLPRRPAASASGAGAPPASTSPPKADMHGRRLIVLFFDLSSMQPEELDRAIKAAHDYVDRRLSPADSVAVASFSTSLQVEQDFTADRESLAAAIDAFGGVNGAGFEEGTTGDTEGTVDNGAAFTVDDTEFNIFNTDRRLDALQTLSDALSGIEQKKSVIYFSSGMNQTGQENQVELRRTVDRANRANVSIYAADMRGLQAQVPGGDASTGSTRGTGAFSGQSTRNQFDRLAATQDTLTTMAEDTGGRAFFDSNAFGQVFDRVVDDTSAYYVLGYSSTNAARDGRFRRVKVALKRSDLKLEYRSGYYAPRDFAHSTKDDREQQLQDQMLSDLSATDLSAYVSPAFFRIGDNRFYVPLSVVVPGYQVPLTRSTPKDKATIDVLGLVRDAQNRPVGRIRDTVRLSPDAADDLKRKTVQYETGLELPPGRYHVKVIVRENLDGTIGSYETDFAVPDLKTEPVKLSSVVVGTQLQPGARGNDRNPLVTGGRELIPNVTHVVSPGQHLYFYYEVYDPAKQAAAAPAIHVLTSIAFFRGKVRAFETPTVEAKELTSANRKSAVFQFDVPIASLKPGLYTCQVNVIDDAAGTFAFPRLQLYVRR